MATRCEQFCSILCIHFVVLIFFIMYWAFEAAMLIVWVSLGIGASYIASSVVQVCTSERLPHAWEAYITIYILACGVYFQTGFHLTFCEQGLQSLRKKATIPYNLFRLVPIRILILLSFYEMFAQFRIRFNDPSLSLDYDYENQVTFKFLLAVCFLSYTIGRKCRQDFKLDLARSGLVFVCPHILTYVAVFSLLYIMEMGLLFICGLPLIFLSLTFNYYYFEEMLTYFLLSAAGVMMGYIVAGLEMDYTKKIKLFKNEPMTPIIYGEVKNNVVLFTIIPLLTRWYFRIEINYKNFEEANKLNFILFSINVAFLLLYFVKQLYLYKEDGFFLVRHNQIQRQGQIQRGLDLINQANRTEIHPSHSESCTISTGSFSGTVGGNSSASTEAKKEESPNSSVNGNYVNDFPTTLPPVVESTEAGSGSLQSSRTFHEFPTVGTISIPLTPLTSSTGIIKIDKRWRDQMLNPGHIRKLSSKSNNRTTIPSPIYNNLAPPPPTRDPF